MYPPVIVSSDSECRLESNDLAPCSVLVVQSEQPEVEENEEILFCKSSVEAPGLRSRVCHEVARGRGEGSGHKDWFES